MLWSCALEQGEGENEMLIDPRDLRPPAPQFRLDLKHDLKHDLLSFADGGGLHFPTPPRPVAGPPKEKAVTLNVSYTLARLLLASQCLIVVILASLIGVMAYTTFQLSREAADYMTALQPYVDEARERTLHILRNADESSDSLHNLASGAESIGASSMPAMASALNRTTQAVAHMAELMRRPTLKMTVE